MKAEQVRLPTRMRVERGALLVVLSIWFGSLCIGATVYLYYCIRALVAFMYGV